MQINNVDNSVAFSSRRSIKRMLKLPAISQPAKDYNNLIDLGMKEVKKNIDKIPYFELKVNNRSSLERTKMLMGNRLSIDSGVELGAKDQCLKIPSLDIIKLFDIVSENPKKPISKLISKFDKIPSISQTLDYMKALLFVNKSTADEICEIVGFKEVNKKAILMSFRECLTNTNESLNDLISPVKKQVSDALKEMDKETYGRMKAEVESLIDSTRGEVTPEKLAKIKEQIDKIIKIINFNPRQN